MVLQSSQPLDLSYNSDNSVMNNQQLDVTSFRSRSAMPWKTLEGSNQCNQSIQC